MPPKKSAGSVESRIGRDMHRLVEKLFPICRSITGEGFRKTLSEFRERIPLKVHNVPSGTRVLDWTVPREWTIRDAYILDEKGRKVVDFKESNLHVVGYSTPVDKWVTASELQRHLHSLENQPDAIPYVTSYYQEYWGFCLTHRKRAALKDGKYRVVIDSDLKNGFLTYGEYILPGKSKKEIFLSTYLCHPSMANNELSGPVVTTFLAQWLASAPRFYTYRIIFIPETIGSITYLSKNLRAMKKNVAAGFNITCVGDDRAYSYVPSRDGGTLADRVALKILQHKHPDFIRYTFLDRGSDERQYCSPGVDLPVASVMRSKYGAYPEYHTSLDDLQLVTPAGLQGAYDVLKDCLELLERNKVYRATCLGEPQLGRRGLYPTLSAKNHVPLSIRAMKDFLAYADGRSDVVEISDKIHVAPGQLYPIIDKLEEMGLIREAAR